MTGPRFTDLAASLPATVPFVGPEAQERRLGRAFRGRLGANESGFGPSPAAIAAMRDAAAGAWMYGDPENHDLKAALAALHGTTPAHVVVGEGIDGLLGYLVRLLVAPGDPVVTSDGAYPTFNYHVAGFGGILHKVPYRGDAEDPEALVAKAAEVGSKIVYLANPDNPMGSWHGADTIRRMVAAVPDGTLLALDEAYVDLAPDGTAPAIDPDDPRVIRFRTFSKAHGLAGARVGYAIGAPDLIRAFDKVRNHFGMCRISQAGALAALGDAGWLAEVRGRVAAARDRIAAIAAENGLSALPSATNFVAIDCGRDGAFARQVLAGLTDRGVFVRMPFVAPQDRCIRVSCGPDPALDALAAALPGALAAARAGLLASSRLARGRIAPPDRRAGQSRERQMNRRQIIAAGLALPAGMAAAQAQTMDHSAHAGHGAMPDTPATRAYVAANDRMHAGMAIEYTGDADVDFLRGMIPHHQGAVDMARIVIEHGTDPEVRAFAEAILAAQEAEIEWMRAWLANRGM